jgi:hypothetical protein
MGRAQINGKSGNTLEVDSNGAAQVSLAGSNATQANAIVPNDGTVIPVTKGLYLGTTGDVVVTMANGQDATFKGLASGMIHPICVTKVKATGTNATSILAVY